MDDRQTYWCGDYRALRAGDDLLVYGRCTFRTGGWDVAIEVGNQGINPDPTLLRLDLHVTEPTGGIPDVITHRLPSLAVVNDSALRIEIDGQTVEVEDIAAGDAGAGGGPPG